MMVMIQHPKGEFYLDDKLYSELLCGHEDCVLDDDDFVIIIDGKEGAGKSTLARQIGYFFAQLIDKEFNEDNIHFDSDPYQQASESSNVKGYPNILDESRSSLNRLNTTTKKSKIFTNYMSECRDKNQMHIILLPAYHDLDKYIATWRVKIIIHCHKTRIEDEERKSGYKLKRDTFALYTKKELINFYMNPRKYGYYSYPKARRYGKFSNFEVLDNISNYKEKKAFWRAKKIEDRDNKDEITSNDIDMQELIKNFKKNNPRIVIEDKEEAIWNRNIQKKK